MKAKADNAAQRILNGEISHPEWILGLPDCQLVPMNSESAYLVCRGIVGNVTAIKTSDGLVVVDSGTSQAAPRIVEELRKWNQDRIHTIVITHGHWDHLAGVPTMDREAESKGNKKPHVISHANVIPRVERYILTAGHNTAINKKQFPNAKLKWPPEHRLPDETYQGETKFTVGERKFELFHGYGETDDHTWVWIDDLKTVVTGDFFIWSGPNVGNPQKVQRYAKGWEMNLRRIMTLNPEVLVPGHGPAIYGESQIQTVLADTVEYLEVIHDNTLEMMNRGERLDHILHSVKIPAHLQGKPYLAPTYDHPEFVIRNIWRLYGGWYDGNPSHLMPAPEAELAKELADLAGGVEKLAKRAEALAKKNNLRLAGHLAEFAVQAAPENTTAHKAREKVFHLRAEQERSLMARNIFSTTAQESASKSKKKP